MKTVTDKNKLFAPTESRVHNILVAPGSDECLKIWIKEPTFLQLEKAQAKLINLNTRTGDVELEMDTMFRYLWEAFVDKTEPSLSVVEVLRLSPYIGNQIKEIMPDPFDMSGAENLKENTNES